MKSVNGYATCPVCKHPNVWVTAAKTIDDHGHWKHGYATCPGVGQQATDVHMEPVEGRHPGRVGRQVESTRYRPVHKDGKLGQPHDSMTAANIWIMQQPTPSDWKVKMEAGDETGESRASNQGSRVLIDQLVEAQGQQQFSTTLVDAEGESIPVDVYISPITDRVPGGRVRVHGSNIDDVCDKQGRSLKRRLTPAQLSQLKSEAAEMRRGS
jgi:phage gp16-like protein